MIVQWLLAAVHLSAFGLVRAFGGVEKGSACHLHAPLFHLKMTALVIVLLLEIRPMQALLRWRAASACRVDNNAASHHAD